jgi:putative chitobiose transport system permease protein
MQRMMFTRGASDQNTGAELPFADSQRWRRKLKRRIGENLTAYAFLLLPMAVLTIFFFYPLVDTLRLSLTQFRGFGPRVFVGLENYRRLAADPKFWLAIKNTVIYAVGVVFGLVTFPMFLAILTNSNVRGTAAFRAMYYIPTITSMVIIGITFTMLYNKYGLLNYGLSLVGLSNFQPAWLANPRLALPAIMFVTVWHSAGYYMMIYYTGLKGLSLELYEAAMIDGATRWQCIRYLTIPLMRPYVTLVTVIAMIGAMKVFVEVYIMTHGGPAGATQVVNLYIYDTAFTFLKMGYAAAIGVVLLVIILVLSMATMGVLERSV